MFIYSIRASTLKLFLCIGLCLAILFTLLAFGSTDAVYASVSGKEINYGGMKTNEDRVKFIEGFGIQVKDDPSREESFTLPDDFDRIIEGYNQVQRAQGLDLTRYKGKRVTHYAYEVTNYKWNGTVYVNLIVWRSKIIAADISSTADGGFISSLVDFDTSCIN